ncbi:MAG: hypothetical protein ABIP71_01065, partial [Verrucomicrobiota bacterium]
FVTSSFSGSGHPHVIARLRVSATSSANKVRQHEQTNSAAIVFIERFIFNQFRQKQYIHFPNEGFIARSICRPNYVPSQRQWLNAFSQEIKFARTEFK